MIRLRRDARDEIGVAHDGEAAHALRAAGRDAQTVRGGRRRSMAREVLRLGAMAVDTLRPSPTWTVLLHVIMWTTMTVGFIMVWVVLLMH